MFRSDAIRGTETVIKPVVMLVRTVMAVNCRMTMIAWLCRTSDCDVDPGSSLSGATWSAGPGCRSLSSREATSRDIVSLVVAKMDVGEGRSD